MNTKHESGNVEKCIPQWDTDFKNVLLYSAKLENIRNKHMSTNAQARSCVKYFWSFKDVESYRILVYSNCCTCGQPNRCQGRDDLKATQGGKLEKRQNFQ